MNALRLLSAASLAASLPVIAALMVSEDAPVSGASPVKLSGASAIEAFVTAPKLGQIAVQSVAEALPAKALVADGITEVVLARGPLLADAPIIEVSSGSLADLSQPLPTNAPQSQGVIASFQAPQQGNGPAAALPTSQQVAQQAPFQLPSVSAPFQSGGSAAPATAAALAAAPPISAVPLPAGGLLLLTALGGAIALRRRAKR